MTKELIRAKKEIFICWSMRSDKSRLIRGEIFDLQFITFSCYVFLTSPQMLNSKYMCAI
jgi:hypothetical protein